MKKVGVRVVSVRGTATLASAGKRAIANSMYSKGKAFLGAAILLSKQPKSEATDYVFLYLMCQSVEVVLKGLLLREPLNSTGGGSHQ